MTARQPYDPLHDLAVLVACGLRGDPALRGQSVRIALARLREGLDLPAQPYTPQTEKALRQAIPEAAPTAREKES